MGNNFVGRAAAFMLTCGLVAAPYSTLAKDEILAPGDEAADIYISPADMAKIEFRACLQQIGGRTASGRAQIDQNFIRFDLKDDEVPRIYGLTYDIANDPDVKSKSGTPQRQFFAVYDYEGRAFFPLTFQWYVRMDEKTLRWDIDEDSGRFSELPPIAAKELKQPERETLNSVVACAQKAGMLVRPRH